MTLTGVRKLYFSGPSSFSCQGTGGMPCALEFSGKNLTCEAGDLIVRD